MSLIIPDVTICNVLNTALNTIRTDYQVRVSEGHENRSFLYLLFNGVALGKYNLYDNAKSLLINTLQTNPKFIDVKLSYDQNTNQTTPAIFLTLPAENDSNNDLNLGIGDQNELMFNNLAPEQDEYKYLYNRRWATTYHLVIIAENRNEMLVLYNLMKSLIVACMNHFSLSGIEKLKIGGSDIRLDHIAPDKLFKRTITLNFEYEQQVPEIDFNLVYHDLFLFWKLEGSETAQGPIYIDDSDSDSF